MTSTKRKADSALVANSPAKKQHLVSSQGTPSIRNAFRSDLFDASTTQTFKTSYTSFGPYPHAVVPSLIEQTLLRNVRDEIISNISFTLKETDIYSIHQSGDLANLSNLDTDSLSRLPSLVRLRDALYSTDFRNWISSVTGCGHLSGQKTDMAVNVYTPGSYLLCHDDVIGSRRVSYILYLTPPNDAWQPEWGGGLRLYPTETKKDRRGEDVKVPFAEYSLNIPPSFSQMSFFEVRPGESYHDVEEVYHGVNAQEDERRVRMAVSGWFHVPQEGETGYEKGLEETLAQRSSLAQLKGAADEFDEPQEKFRRFDEARIVENSQANGTEVDPGGSEDGHDDILTEQDLTFLLQYMSPGFLVPDKLEELAASFEDTSMLELQSFLREDYATKMREYIEDVESGKGESDVKDHPTQWKIARPPHKHKFAYIQEDQCSKDGGSPLSKLLVDLLHSHAFKKWLALATGFKSQSLVRQHSLARRFRRGHDYMLASGFAKDQPQLEFTISLTPSTGWETTDNELESDVAAKGKFKDSKLARDNGQVNGHSSTQPHIANIGAIVTGGEEIYMTGDDDDAASTHSKALPSVGKKATHDPAVYQAGGEDEEDPILFVDSPRWNMFSVVLRDRGTLRFVKYVSQAAKGDRWDVKGEIELASDAFDEEDGENDDDLEYGSEEGQSEDEDGVGSDYDGQDEDDEVQD